MDATPRQAEQRVQTAIDRGVNYFDVAPSYGDAEIKLGPALASHRSQVFLACKTAERNKQAATRELEQSLKRLHTDHFDHILVAMGGPGRWPEESQAWNPDTGRAAPG